MFTQHACEDDEWGENSECILKNERSVVNKFVNAHNLCKTEMRRWLWYIFNKRYIIKL